MTNWYSDMGGSSAVRVGEHRTADEWARHPPTRLEDAQSGISR
jgi:hypothetical protein